MTILQSSVSVKQVNFPMVTSFLQNLLRTPVFPSAAILVLREVVQLLYILKQRTVCLETGV